MDFLKVLSVALLINVFHIEAQAGDCVAQARCKNGMATCSVQSSNPGDGSRIDAYCGEMNAGDKFMTCWIEKREIKTVRDIVCCDKNGNAVLGGWSNGGAFNTAICVGYQ